MIRSIDSLWSRLSPGADRIDACLLNDFQRDFPLVARPFARLARELGCDEGRVIARLRDLLAAGTVSRVGAVFSPRRVGASTLAALKVAPQRLDRVASVVSAFPGVNHNYAREHAWNLWFVLSAPDAVSLARTLREIHRDTRSPLIALPLLTEYHIDLGFDLRSGARAARAAARVAGPQRLPAADELSLMVALQDGLPLRCRPFAAIARRAGLAESRVLEMLSGWHADGTLKRFGVVVRHHELGYRANAMCVWDVPDPLADHFGTRLAACEGVNLCYRRRRAGPDWNYNLYCMIHGRDHHQVRARIGEIGAACGLAAFPSDVLFSTRRFKQCGARYFADTAHG